MAIRCPGVKINSLVLHAWELHSYIGTSQDKKYMHNNAHLHIQWSIFHSNISSHFINIIAIYFDLIRRDMLMSRVSNFKKLRLSAVILGVSNMMVIILGIIIITLVYPTCRNGDIFPFLVVVLVSCVRIIAMIRTAIAQLETANLVLKSHGETPIVDALMRHERRVFMYYFIFFFPINFNLSHA